MNQDFLDLLRAFADHNVRFLVVGAYALAVHGRPRATGDLDVWVDASNENAPHLIEALQAFGAPLDEVSVADFCRPGIVFQIGLAPRRIDILTALTGLTFEEAWKHRVLAAFGDQRVSVIGRDDFIANKKAAGRQKDLADVEGL
jgi:hypothetical protein